MKAVGWGVGGYEKTLNEKSGTLDFMDQSILNEAIQGQSTCTASEIQLDS